MAVTLKEVAKLAGVSLSTASHAIRGIDPGKRSLSAFTIKRVREVAEQLGYRPNLIAAGLANNKTFTIGVMIPHLKGNFYERIIRGLNEIIYPNYTTLLSIHNNDVEMERKGIEFLIGKRVDGVIAGYSGSKENLHLYRELQKHSPVVLVDRSIEDFDSYVVKSDYYLSTYLAVEELVKLGHKNILFVFCGKQLENKNKLLTGFKAAISDFKLNNSAEIYSDCDSNVPGRCMENLAAKVIDYIKSDKQQITAVLTGRDWLAYEMLAVCQERGIKVPQELSIMGIEDSDPSMLRCVSLSSVRIELQEVGRRSAELLLKLINDEEIEKKPIIIKPAVILRKTTAALKQ
jgi:LacI family transcriptional regulator